jgi:PAS domain S-box-containing protein
VLECLPGTEKYWIETYGNVALTGEPVSFENYNKPLGRHYAVTAYSPEKGRFAVIFMDVTEMHKAEEDRERLSIAIDQLDEMVVLTDIKGIIFFANPAFVEITGYSNEEVIGENPRILKSGLHDTAFYRELWTTITSGHRWKGRQTNKRKDGTLYTAECAISPVKNSKGEVINFVWISRDITKETELEKRMVQAQKMEAIGSLAGGIAHDFNNILFPLVGWAEMILEEMTEDSVYLEPVNEILAAAKRARNLVQQILAFSRRAEKDVRPLQLHILVKEVLKLMRSTLPSTITIKQDIDPSTAMVLADPTQIHQVLMNLTTNAYHAMEETGGTLFIQLKNTMFKNRSWSRITISDTGVGINEPELEKIFDPYYTTKDLSRGTGLGLAVVHGIVKGYDGEIVVDSKPGKGTRFDVFLAPYSSDAAFEAESENTEIQGGTQRILIVDDEEKILNLMERMLGHFGYHVRTTVNSMEAVDMVRSDPHAIDLVITDMTMPHMTGDTLARELLKIRPELPIVISTGYSEKLTAEKIEAIGIKGMLQKPILKQELLRMVNEILGNTQ